MCVLQVADQWRVGGASAAASKELCRRIQNFPLSSVYLLPEVLKASPGFSNLMNSAERVLLRWFGDAREVIVNRSRLLLFLHLPIAAVCAMLGSPEFATDGEGSVLMMVSAWIEGQSCSQAQLHQLASLIHYGRLPVTILTELHSITLLPKLDCEQINELWKFRMSPADAEYLENASSSGNHSICPLGWFAPCRPDSCVSPLTTIQYWEVKKSDLVALLVNIGDPEKTALKSSYGFGSGFMWGLDISAGQGTLSCGIHVVGLQSLRSGYNAAASFSTGLPCSILLCMEQVELFSSDKAVLLSSRVTDCILSNLPPNKRGSLPTEAEWWDDLCEDDYINFRAKIIVDNCVGVTRDDVA